MPWRSGLFTSFRFSFRLCFFYFSWFRSHPFACLFAAFFLTYRLCMALCGRSRYAFGTPHHWTSSSQDTSATASAPLHKMSTICIYKNHLFVVRAQFTGVEMCWWENVLFLLSRCSVMDCYLKVDPLHIHDKCVYYKYLIRTYAILMNFRRRSLSISRSPFLIRRRNWCVLHAIVLPLHLNYDR